MTILAAYDVVRLRNTGPTPWKAMYNSQVYQMPVNGEAIAPFIAACNWFGHPDAIDNPVNPRERFRTDEVARLRVYYGAYDDEVLWEANTPKVEVFNLDGERILMVLDDPDGTSINPAVQTEAEKAGLQTQIAAMQRQMQQMQAALDIQQRAEIAEQLGDIVEDDTAPAVQPTIIPDAVVPVAGNAVPSPEVSEDTPTRIKVSSR